MPHLKVFSVFSHLAASDEPIHNDFTRKQINTLKEVSKQITKRLGYPVIRHILNSSGIERFPEGQMEMVRLGIGIYGISSVQQKELRHVGTLKTVISQIREVDNSETIGYSRKGKVTRKSKVAVLPIGYADGYLRKLGNGAARVLINNKFARTIGNICMDMCMVDITGIDAMEGDEAILFGEGIPITELAGILETIPYEILTSISARVNRVFIKE
jgi:alanine racemase